MLKCLLFIGFLASLLLVLSIECELCSAVLLSS